MLATSPAGVRVIIEQKLVLTDCFPAKAGINYSFTQTLAKV
jgi:hypothetical protein